ncbi:MULTISPECIES: GNAT family N-acetyltransferase [Flavobacterium]|uniref:GNAT family N-acetyltransferase n=2 Tax=Flavobacterium TaxID=237 RepID=A0AA94F6A7_9FLAO|nr:MULTISPECIES: GNAT family N-acetyltransferase [Flavobacterium]OXA78482.1 N-acetyltransferase [Flavobacterium columnare] [Flavobacterium columnare NBRC 100251 = ATCC 23463]AMA49584.1 acetyltransferase [Flavobacterium covae]AND63281.1 acetyltransferase [Flavobacterium covae]MCH4828869.1 GNAT family N-acetyltransferase [Flavobacterium columnare]MCH4832123.1 GNAT family N-acetyltransferase [Flavobacterium columnare]
MIRLIRKEDNREVAALIRTVLEEYKAPKEGTAYEDPQLDVMFETYQKIQSAYFILELSGKIVGCAGIAPLKNATTEVCELQKMYFLSSVRGKGWGTQMMKICLDKAKEMGFEKCYLETLTTMEKAQRLYLKSGFIYLSEPMGNTGHSACPIWMLKEL